MQSPTSISKLVSKFFLTFIVIASQEKASQAARSHRPSSYCHDFVQMLLHSRLASGRASENDASSPSRVHRPPMVLAHYCQILPVMSKNGYQKHDNGLPSSLSFFLSFSLSLSLSLFFFSLFFIFSLYNTHMNSLRSNRARTLQQSLGTVVGNNTFPRAESLRGTLALPASLRRFPLATATALPAISLLGLWLPMALVRALSVGPRLAAEA